MKISPGAEVKPVAVVAGTLHWLFLLPWQVFPEAEVRFRRQIVY
jgi:hypothetical protein